MLDLLFLILNLYQQKCFPQPIEWGLETRSANQRSREIKNFARHLMSELSLVGNWQGEKKKEKERTENELKSVHIGYSD